MAKLEDAIMPPWYSTCLARTHVEGINFRLSTAGGCIWDDSDDFGCIDIANKHATIGTLLVLFQCPRFSFRSFSMAGPRAPNLPV